MRVIRLFLLTQLLFLAAVSSADAFTIEIVFAPPTTNADGTPLTNLAGYNLYSGAAKATYGAPRNLGNNTSAIISNLEENHDYYFAVTAYDTSGNESGFSNEVHLNFAPILPMPTQTPTRTPTPLATGTVVPGPTESTTPISSITPNPTPKAIYPKRVKMDFDGDGLSDPGVFNPASGTEFVSLSADAVDLEVGFAEGGGRRADGDYNGDGKWDSGIVARQPDGKLLITAKDAESDKEIFREEFGRAGNRIVTGCYLDGDKKTDIVVLTKTSMRIRESSKGKIVKARIPAGLVRDVYCGDFNNDGRDQLTLLMDRKPFPGKKPVTSVVILNSRGRILKQHEARRGKRLLVADFNRDKRDEIAYIFSKKGETYVKFFAEKRTWRFNLGVTSSQSAATYLAQKSGNGDAILKRDKTGVSLFNFLSQKSSPVSSTLPEGELISPVSSNHF